MAQQINPWGSPVSALSSYFSWDRARKTGVAEASDLRWPVGTQFPQVYPDACDVGFVMVLKDGTSATWWYLADEDRDPQGEDVVGFRFEPTPEAELKHPELKGWAILVIND